MSCLCLATHDPVLLVQASGARRSSIWMEVGLRMYLLCTCMLGSVQDDIPCAEVTEADSCTNVAFSYLPKLVCETVHACMHVG